MFHQPIISFIITTAVTTRQEKTLEICRIRPGCPQTVEAIPGSLRRLAGCNQHALGTVDHRAIKQQSPAQPVYWCCGVRHTQSHEIALPASQGRTQRSENCVTLQWRIWCIAAFGALARLRQQAGHNCQRTAALRLQNTYAFTATRYRRSQPVAHPVPVQLSDQSYGSKSRRAGADNRPYCPPV